MLHVCFTPIALCFVYTLWRFYAFSETNLLTRCHSVSSCFLLFCVSEKLHRKYSRNWTKQKSKFLFTWREDGVQRRDRAGPGGDRTIGWRGRAGHPLAAPPGGVRPWSTPDIALQPINFLRQENPKETNSFPQNILQVAAVVVLRSGGSRCSSRHPAGEGNHHRRPSSSSCQPPEWCVSSLPWTMGP
jgi:hypothetical protein